MKVKVIRKFIDKETKVLRKVGDVFTCSKDRFAEITKAGNYVVEVEEKPAKAKKAAETETNE